MSAESEREFGKFSLINNGIALEEMSDAICIWPRVVPPSGFI